MTYVNLLSCTYSGLYIFKNNGVISFKSDNKITTTKVENEVWFSKYAAIHPDAEIRYHACGMVLHINNNASYLSVRRSCSLVGDHFYLSSSSVNRSEPPTFTSPNNGSLRVTCSILSNIMALAVEAEL